MKKLKSLISSKNAKICIIGLGYVGLPLAIKLAKKGFKVYGFDNDERKIKDLEHNYIYVDTIELKDFCMSFRIIQLIKVISD